jgi:Protein of unknown function (DUF3108)
LHRLLLSAALRPGCWAIALAALSLHPLREALRQDAEPIEGTATPAREDLDPRAWLPANESLRFKVEVTVGPVRGLDVGKVLLECSKAPELEDQPIEAAQENASRRLIGTIKTVAKGGYLGYEVLHTIGVNWYIGSRPRIELDESLRGSNCSAREIRVGEDSGQWKLEYRKDRHCKGCKNKKHFVDGLMPWSDPHHCKDCERPEHRVWRDYKYLDIPPDSMDMVSALYFARSFVRSGQPSLTLSLINQDELWTVELQRGEQRAIETPAGEFDCVRVLIGPKLAAGEGMGPEASERFEALFGLHGNISLWVDKAGGFPVRIEGKAPFGPLDVAIKASLTDRDGG